MKKRFSDEQIISMLKEQEAGDRTADVCRRHGISQATFYKYKAKYGGMEPLDAVQGNSLHLKKHYCRDSSFVPCPHTNVPIYKMLHHAPMAASAGRTAASRGGGEWQLRAVRVGRQQGRKIGLSLRMQKPRSSNLKRTLE